MDVFCASILTEIEHRLVTLDCANDILRFSFLAQNSILPLDLSQQEGPLYLISSEYLIGFSTSSVLGTCIQYPKYVINTEEKCRKILSRTRDFLYRLHLDLPKRRECSLKDGPEPENMNRDCCRRHIGKIAAHPNFHFTVLSRFVKEAVKRSNKKLKLIKWLVTFDAVTKDAFLNNQHVNYFMDYLYSEDIESTFVKAFLKKLYLVLWISNNNRPEMLEFFLYHLRQKGTYTRKKVSRYELIEVCMGNLKFLNIAAILKYQDAPRVPSRDAVRCIYTLSIIREGLNCDALIETEKWMSPRRFYFLIQILFLYLRDETASAATCLCLLWKSIPDAFFSREEIEMALQAGMSSETIRDVYNFYSSAVGAHLAHAEPRTLKHLCRPVVRRMLWDSGCWIPDGIKLIDVPKALQSFLNLED